VPEPRNEARPRPDATPKRETVPLTFDLELGCLNTRVTTGKGGLRPLDTSRFIGAQQPSIGAREAFERNWQRSGSEPTTRMLPDYDADLEREL